jgi:hypothetical protein
MTAPFAAIEAATATAAVAALSNADATIGLATVAVIFDNAFADPLGIVADTRPVAHAKSADVSTVAVGNTVVINAVTYTVAEIHPDGTGITQLVLKT